MKQNASSTSIDLFCLSFMFYCVDWTLFYCLFCMPVIVEGIALCASGLMETGALIKGDMVRLLDGEESAKLEHYWETMGYCELELF